jgi:gliding motility-associated-like protein
LFVRELPKVDFTVEKMGGCDPFTAKFSAKVEEEGDYFWTFGDSDSSLIANPEHLYKKPGDYKVNLIFGKPGCSNKIEKIVTSYEVPIAAFTTYPEPGVVGSIQNFADESINSAKWFWAFGDGEFSQDQVPSHVYSNDGVYEIVQIVSSVNDCKDTVSYKLVVENNIGVFFPKSFTPNKDGLNDLYEVKVSGINPNPGNFEMSIFNRWGNRVYHSTDYATHAWDGGTTESDNLYILKLKVQDKEGTFYNYKSTITVIK